MMCTMTVFALDSMTTGVLAANSAVMTLSGAPKTSRALFNTGNRKASPGSSSDEATATKAIAPTIVCKWLEVPFP